MLATRLRKYKNIPGVVLAVPRGGIPVAYEIAKELNIPLEVILVKKLGHPNNKEYAIAKVYDENVFTWNVVNGKVIHQLTYFRMENINGLEFKQKSLKNDMKTK